MNLLEIKQAVRDIVVDVTAVVESNLLKSIQRAQRELELKTFCPEQDISLSFYLSETFSTSESYYFDFENAFGQSYDFIRLSYDPYMLDRPSSNIEPHATPMIRVTGSEAKQLYATALGVLINGTPERGKPKYFMLENNVVYFFPLPDDNGPNFSGTYHIEIPFYRHLPPLVDDSDTNWFTDNDECSEYLIFRAAEDSLRLIRDPLFATYRQLAMERKREATIANRRSKWSMDDFIDVKPAARIGSYRP